MTATVKLTGFAELEKELDKLSKAAGKAALRRALKTSAQPLADLAASMAPDDTSTKGYDLKKSIGVSTILSRSQKKAHRKMFGNDKAAVEMFVGAGPVPQAVYTEFGTSPFINKGLYAGTQNPGIRPQPFMRPAWDQDQKALLDRLKDQLWIEIQKAIGRAERKAARDAAKG